MHFSYQTVVLAALAFESAFAQPSYRHSHHHKQRDLADVLGKRQNWNDPNTYINPATNKPYTPAEWQCIVANPNDQSHCTSGGGSSSGGSPPPASSPTGASAPVVQEKIAAKPSSSSAAPASSNTAAATSGSTTDSGPGAHIFNKGSQKQTFVFYENDGNDAGQSSTPGQQITLNPGADQFVSLPTTWKGHVQRGQSDPKVISPATWAEIQVKATDGKAWGDISLQKGCDGPAKIISASDPSQAFGFTHDIVSGAPAAAKVKTADGADALGFTTGGWMGSTLEQPNQAAIDWEQQQVGQSQVYILGGTGTQVAQSSNNVLHVEFY